eukprot:TRINITY_DN2666_c2_g1_i1.p1 TRINITY_DN2666_c2_g1~~TRINITY_DN2666_c2_g1_i1.p1  ORF type:complete len:562 (+),score=49.25 TRINITY_DN2666_c2_g1_i1:256-1941(+)
MAACSPWPRTRCGKRRIALLVAITASCLIGLCVFWFVREPLIGEVPEVRLTFSATLEQVVWSSETGYTQRVHGAITADAGILTYSTPIKYPGGRTAVEINRFDHGRGTYHFEPFFGELVCYVFAQSVFKSSAVTVFEEYKRRLLLETLGYHSHVPQHAKQGELASLDGRACRMYRFRRDRVRYEVCIGFNGELLSSNFTTWIGDAPSFGVSRFFRNYSLAFDPSLMPFTDDCLDLRGGPDNMLSHSHVNNASFLAAVRSSAAGAWHATAYDRFANLSFDQVKTSLFGTQIRPLQLPLVPAHIALNYNAVTLGDEFDAREKWKSCASVGSIRNQGDCGACYAFAAVEVLADRVCIGGGERDLTLSAEYLVSCDKRNEGCSGGAVDTAWNFLTTVGAPREQCCPYRHCANPEKQSCLPGSPRRARDVCPATCADGSAVAPLRAAWAYAVARPGDWRQMMTEIAANGPIHASFFVFSDFILYKNGTYFRTPEASLQGGHSVRLLGWGVDDSATSYWLAANTWGLDWGMRGFFRIRRGTNECGMESTPAAGVYKRSGSSNFEVTV